MSITIGGLSFDDYRGLPHPFAAACNVERSPLGGVRLTGGMRRYHTSECVTWSMHATEAAAITAAQFVSRLVGTRVIVTVGGISSLRVYVTDAECHYRLVYHDAATDHLLTVRWQFGEPPFGGDAKDRYLPTDIEYSDDFKTWLPAEDLRASAMSEGFGQQLGAVTMVQCPVDDDNPQVQLTGKYVRVRLPNDDNLDYTEGDKEDVQRWSDWRYYVALTEDLIQVAESDDSYRRECRWECASLEAELDTQLRRWYEWRDSDAATVVDPCMIPAFNARDDGDRGADGTAVDGSSYYIHHRDRPAPGGLWWNIYIVQLWLAAVGDQTKGSVLRNEGGPTWRVADQTGCLNNAERMNLDGQSCLSAMARLAGSRGLGWRLRVDADNAVAYLDVKSPLYTALTVGDFEIPANDDLVHVDLTDSTITGDWSIGEDTARVADEIIVEGAQQYRAISLRIVGADTATGQLTPDWDSDLDAGWLAADDDARDSDVYSAVHRHWRLSSTWHGETDNSSAELSLVDMVSGEEGATNSIHGAGGWNGSDYRAKLDDSEVASAYFPVGGITLDEALPYQTGVDLESIGSDTPDLIDPTRTPAQARAYRVRSPGEATEAWEALDIDVSVQSGTRRVTLGRSSVDAALVAAIIEAEDDIVVTMGMHGPKPWRVSWRREELRQFTARRRIVRYRYDDVRWKYMMPGTVIGLSAGQPVRSSGGDLHHTDEELARLTSRLMLARMWHEEPMRELSWRVTGRLEVDTDQQPGALLKTVTLPRGEDDDAGEEVTLRVQIRKRAWDLRRGAPATHYHCSTPGPDAGPSLRPALDGTPADRRGRAGGGYAGT